MVAATGRPRQLDVTRHHDLFGCNRLSLQAQAIGDDALVHDASVRNLRVLTVIHDGPAMTQAVGQRIAHEAWIANSLPVIREADGSRLSHLAHVRELRPSLSAGYGAQRQNPRQCCLAGGQPG